MTTTDAAPIVPSFGEPESGRKLAIICSKGTLDMAYPGLEGLFLSPAVRLVDHVGRARLYEITACGADR